MVFDSRIGLYEDPPQRDPMRFIKAVESLLESTQQVELGFENFLYNHFNTPSWKKLCEAQEVIIEIGQKYVDMKIETLKEKIHDSEGLLNEEGMYTAKREQ